MTSASNSSIFAGTASYYARYRPPYPDELFADLIREFGLDGTGRLLDVGCGTGAVALRLRDMFEEVVGIDPDEGMIAEARRQSEAVGADNVRWLRMAAEEISPALGTFRLVTFGASFHWTDRDRVLRLVYDALSNDGGIAAVALPDSGQTMQNPGSRKLSAS